jgi:hypothetical protein
MKGRLFAVGVLSIGLAATGCGGGGGGGGTVSSSSLAKRLLPASAIPGFGLQRTLDWTDPVNLVGEGLFLPQSTHPSTAVKELTDAHLEGAAGEVLTNGSGPDATDVRVGVAQFKSASDANAVRDWMHTQDERQPCFSQCMFTTKTVALTGIPSGRFVVQSAHIPPPPHAPPGAKIEASPATYLAEFTLGRYLYWTSLQADSRAKARFEKGLQLYYAHAKRAS